MVIGMNIEIRIYKTSKNFGNVQVRIFLTHL